MAKVGSDNTDIIKKVVQRNFRYLKYITIPNPYSSKSVLILFPHSETLPVLVLQIGQGFRVLPPSALFLGWLSSIVCVNFVYEKFPHSLSF